MNEITTRKANKGGEISPVNGLSYKGGQFMPVHGKSKKKKTDPKGKYEINFKEWVIKTIPCTEDEFQDGIHNLITPINSHGISLEGFTYEKYMGEFNPKLTASWLKAYHEGYRTRFGIKGEMENQALMPDYRKKAIPLLSEDEFNAVVSILEKGLSDDFAISLAMTVLKQGINGLSEKQEFWFWKKAS